MMKAIKSRSSKSYKTEESTVELWFPEHGGDMLKTHVVVDTPIIRTARVAQVEGLFDIPPSQKSQVEWDAQLPLEEKPWHIGLIVGPSGCGKSTVARALFGNHFAVQESLPAWPENQSILDGFPPTMPIKEVVELLSSVGFSSP